MSYTYLKMIRLFLLLISAHGVLGNCPGNSLSNQTSAPLELYNNGYDARIIVLKSGRVLTSWQDNDDRQKGQLMESDGTLVGGTILLTESNGGGKIVLAQFKNGFLTVAKDADSFILSEHDNDGVLVSRKTVQEHDGKDIVDKMYLVVFSDDSFSVAYAAPMNIKTSHFDNPGTQDLPNERVQWFNSDLTKRGNPTVSPRYDTPWSVIDPAWNTGWLEHHERIIGAVALEGDRLMTFVWNQHYWGSHPVKNRIHCHVYENNGTIAKWLILNQPTDDDDLRYSSVKAYPGGFVAQRKNEVNVFKVHSNLTFDKTANILPDDLKHVEPAKAPLPISDAASTSTVETSNINVKPIVDGTIAVTYRQTDDDDFDQNYIALYNDGNLASGPYNISGEPYNAMDFSGDNLMVLYDDDDKVTRAIYRLNLCGQPTTPQGDTPTEVPTPPPVDEESIDIGLIIGISVGAVAGVALGVWAYSANNGRKPRDSFGIIV